MNPKLLLSFFLIFAFTSISQVKSKAIETIIIDPGHGGIDAGNKGTSRYKTKEKDIVLDVALRLGKILKKELPNVKILYTRTKDVYPKLPQRANFANKNKGDLFVSIHCDAFHKKHVNGSSCLVLGQNHKEKSRIAIQENGFFLKHDGEKETKAFMKKHQDSFYGSILYQDMFLNQSISLGDKIQNQLITKSKRKNRGVKHQALYLMRAVSMPSVLVELGFLTNHKEEDYLNSNKGKYNSARAIATAIKQYKKEQESIWNASTETYSPPPLTGTYFCVQLMASSKKLQSFKGLDPVEAYQEKGLYKYLYGHATKYQDAVELQKEARKAGYKGAFIVGMKNGKKVSAKDIK